MGAVPNDIPVVFSKVLLDLLCGRGLTPSLVLRGTGIDLGVVADPESRISLEQQIAVYERACLLSGIDDLGLLHGHLMTPGHLGIVGYALQTASTLRQALRTLLSYCRMSGSLLEFRLREEPGTRILTLGEPVAGGAVRRYVLEEHLATVNSILRTITSGRFRPSRVTLDYPAPPWGHRYAEIFRCPVDFDTPEVTYRFDADMLDLRITFADPATSRACEQRCEAMIERMSRISNYVDRVRRTILMMPRRSRHLDAVAAELDCSSRTLRRRLAEQGTSFQTLLTEVRLELASQYLMTTQLPVDEVAVLVGYSEAASFRNAFKTWTGLAPGAYRARHRQRPEVARSVTDSADSPRSD